MCCICDVRWGTQGTDPCRSTHSEERPRKVACLSRGPANGRAGARAPPSGQCPLLAISLRRGDRPPDLQHPVQGSQAGPGLLRTAVEYVNSEVPGGLAQPWQCVWQPILPVDQGLLCGRCCPFCGPVSRPMVHHGAVFGDAGVAWSMFTFQRVLKAF